MSDVTVVPSAPVPRYYVGPHDRITIDRLEYSHAETNGIGHLLCRIDNPKLFETVTHGDFHRLLNAPRFRLDRDWFAPEKAMVRLRAGVASLRDVPDDEQAKIFWKQRWCEAFLEFEATADRRVRGDESMKVAIAEIAPTIANVPPGCNPPDPKRLREWVNDLVFAGGDPLILRDGWHRSGNRTSRLTPDEYAVLVEFAWQYATPTKPEKTDIHGRMEAEIELRNRDRVGRGLRPLQVPSYTRLCEEIATLPKFKVFAGRHGIDQARAKFLPVHGGAGAVRALQRVEMDMWSVQLHVLMIEAGVWETLSEEERATVERSRKVLCVVFDCASECFLAMRFADEKRNSENTDVAIETLEMALCDKSGLAGSTGAATLWEMCGTPFEVTTDTGAAFVAAKFKAAARDAEIGHLCPPAKLPHLRGKVERVFRTAHGQLVGQFEGRTFENPVAKGDYPSEQRASITVDELAWALVRWVVDIYHNAPHDGLGGETPRAAWLRLTSTFPVMPPPDIHKRRAAFGIELERIVTPRGVRILGIHYQAPELQQFLRDEGFGVTVAVRYDAMDMGHISVRLGGAWLTVAAPDDMFQGLDVDTWIATTQELRRRYADLARLTRPIVLEAIRAIRQLADHAARRAKLDSPKMTAERIEQEEKKLSIGFDYVHPETHDTGTDGLASSDSDDAFYARTVKVGQKAPPSHDAAPSSLPAPSEPTSASERDEVPKRRWTIED